MSDINPTVIAAHGRHYMVQVGDARWQCVTRGKKSDVAVGDHVRIKKTADNQGVIEAISPRGTLLFRSDQYKSKLLAANVTQLFIVVATEPSFSDDLISRALVAAEAAGVKAHLILNKSDVVALLPHAQSRLALYEKLGYPIHVVSATAEEEKTVDTLAPLMEGESSILIGQSGMGKSSIINLLIPGADIQTREISLSLNSGKHTTTFTRMYQKNVTTTILDSPGFQEFGLYHLTEGMLERAFREFKPYLGQCRFANCHHKAEPNCAIREAVESGDISPMRHDLYVQLVHESSQKLY